jgi:chlorite dismutase
MYPQNMYPATFIAGAAGTWRVERIRAIKGESLPAADRLEVHTTHAITGTGSWKLRGVAGHVKYVNGNEKAQLDAVSPPLGRAEATRAALIPIRKSPAWWSLPQDERRAILEERSHHISDTLQYLPRVARRLYHARELGEPFDFLTWFEFAAEHAAAFDDLVGMLRATEEWTFVEREVDVRLAR